MKLLKYILPVVVGIIAGVLLYRFVSFHQAPPVEQADTSLVQEAHAQKINQVASTRRNALTEAVKRVSPAVVSVNVTAINKYIQRSPFSEDPFFRQFFPDLFGDRVIEQQVQSIGSGFIISSDGFVVTNEHVVSGAKEILVALENGKEYPAKLVGRDRVADVALLKLDKKQLPFITFGDSDQLLIGEWAIALGNPFGLFVNSQPTVTVGVISAVDRDFSPLEGRVYEDMIQTDAAINPGNSGGPLCDADGEVIGMNTFIFTGGGRSSGSVGVGFAIPSNHIRKVVERLKKRSDKDMDVWLGMYVADLNAYLARMLGYPYATGLYVKRIDHKSPAEKAGLKLGDVITSFNGQEVGNVAEARQVIESLDLRVGDKLYVGIWRAGKASTVVLELTKYPH